MQGKPWSCHLICIKFCSSAHLGCKRCVYLLKDCMLLLLLLGCLVLDHTLQRHLQPATAADTLPKTLKRRHRQSPSFPEDVSLYDPHKQHHGWSQLLPRLELLWQLQLLHDQSACLQVFKASLLLIVISLQHRLQLGH